MVGFARLFLATCWLLALAGAPAGAQRPGPDPAGISFRFVETNGIRVHVAEAGEGPLVILAHGFPETWYSWRHQIAALAAAGYRVAAPDLRGYGRTDKPAEVERYNLLELAGDLVGLVAALGEEQAVLIGHDWGAILAARASLLRPDIFRATVLLSVPYAPRGDKEIPPMEAIASATPEGMVFYQVYFQEPGVAERELEREVRRAFLMALYSASGSASAEERWRPFFRPDEGILSSLSMPTELPAWLREEDIDEYVRQFQESGFRGPLNWYRNIDRNWRLLGAFRGARLMQPTLFIGGELDPALAARMGSFEELEEHVPNLARKVLLRGKGHWIQQEAPEEVNRLILEFLSEQRTRRR